jgi:carbon monoxide dehydrogenase subunit G
MRIETSVEIDRPPEEVYRLVMDPSRLHEWVSIHHDVLEAPSGGLKQGSTMTQSLKVAGQRFKVRWRVVEDDSPRRVVWEGNGPVWTRARVVYDFDERDGGTRFSYANEYELPGGAAGRMAGRYVGRAAQREMARSLERLKGVVEAGGV